MLRRGILVVILLLPVLLKAQITSLKGSVVDSVTGEKLPFVTILVNDLVNQGVSTDTGGNFTLKSVKPITSIKVSFVGYETKRITFKSTDQISSVNIFLAPQQMQLEDVTVMSGENPANRIIKMAVQNRDQNNYAKLNSYAFKAYEKFTVTGFPPDSIYSDSLRTKMFRFMDNNHLSIIEAVVERKHLQPDLTKETVIAQKVSGLNSPNFTLLTSQLQTTNFYQPYIDITTTDFVNPISPNSWEKYFFNIEDTIYQGKDTVFVMSYHPAKGKHFSSLEGIIEINTDGYAIQLVKAKPSDTLLATLRASIEQRYGKADSTHWFPTYLGTNLSFQNFIFPGLRVEVLGQTYIKDPIINPPLTKKDFDGVNIDLLDDLAKDDPFWVQNRLDTLTAKEKVTYQVFDSLNRKYHFDRKFQWANAWQDGLLRFPYVSVEIYNTIKFNKPEFMRIGLGLETNRDFSKRYVLTGFAGYGIRDAIWKYGGSVKWKIYEPKNIALKFAASMNYEENGGLTFFQGSYWGSGTGLRNYTINVFDLVNREELSFTARIRKFVNFQLKSFTAFKQITNNYEFLDTSGDEPVLLNEFRFSGFQAAIRWSYKERVVESLDHYYWVNSGYPVLWLQVTQGIKGYLHGDFTYTKYEAAVSYSFNTKSFGITSFTFGGGYVNGLLPSSELYAGRSSYAPIGLYAPGSFQTMRSGEFMDDRFVALFLKQDFLYNVIRWGHFQPNIVFITNIGWGKLTDPEVHVNATFHSMDQGYFESGIIANNLLSKKMIGIVRFGLGFGVFYRYGYYTFPQVIDNFSFKATFSYNFK